ncbi:MAG: response regulator/GGDEF protein, partial [Myxococcaceae bacterium]|nr:response regulator/GGDEF protein [Myxococcaceae bacterium]
MALALVAEPSLPICAALRKFLEGARHEVIAAHSVAEAVDAMALSRPPDVVFASSSGNFDGEALCARIKGLSPLCPVVLVYPPDEDLPEERAARVGADGFLLGPLKRAAVVAMAQLVLRNAGLKSELAKSIEQPKAREAKLLEATSRLNAQVAELKGREEPLKQRLQALEAEVKRLKDQLKQGGGASAGSEIGFLKRFLPLEVKRSRRYQYPVAVVLIGLDHLAERLAAAGSPEFQRAAIRSEAIAGIYKVIRDIDLTVPFADDKYLVLLPHTPRDGAMTVASRLQAELSKMAAFDGGTAS